MNTIVWRDLDLSMNKNIYNDIGTLNNENAIVNALYNRLTIGDKEMPFYLANKQTIDDFLHDTLDFITVQDIQDFIKFQALKDKRILYISQIEVIDNSNNYSLDLKIHCRMNIGTEKETTISISVAKI